MDFALRLNKDSLPDIRPYFGQGKRGYNKQQNRLLGCRMKCRRMSIRWLLLPLLASLAFAGNPSADSQSPPISKQTRLELIHLVNAELVYVKSPFPMGKDGLKLKDGVVSPSGEQLQQAIAMWGPAAKVGDPARITAIVFKPTWVHVEINGGPIKKQKWYEHISVGGMGGETPIEPTDPNSNPRGSFVDIYFDKYVPEMTGDEFKDLLAPVLDFHAKSQLEAFLDTMPPKVKEAIQEHRVLVGMNHEMVTYAKGRPPKKVRERDGETEYEEWIYGDPPQDVLFVRFVGDEVVRLETMKVSGEKLVKTDKEVDVQPNTNVAKQTDTPERPKTVPTLRRPGEDNPDAPPQDRGPTPIPQSSPSPQPGPTPN